MAGETQQTDHERMRAIVARDPEALRGLFESHAPLMLALGKRILGQTADAEDVLNEVFWEVWTKADRYDPRRGSVKSYLLLIMRSRCLDRLRARKSRPDSSAAALNTQLHSDGKAAPEAGMLAAEANGQVRDAVEELDEQQRAAIELSFYQGLSHQQIAELTGTPLGTVKGRLRSGLIKLRHSLRSKEGVKD